MDMDMDCASDVYMNMGMPACMDMDIDCASDVYMDMCMHMDMDCANVHGLCQCAWACQRA